MASSRTTNTSLQNRLKISNEVDRISVLPDSVLCFILSFLDTKESVQTCILSKRWKFLWTNVPSRSLHSHQPSFRSDVESFENFVTMTLLLHKYQSLNKFHLLCELFEDASYDVTAWLTTAITRDVQELDLSVVSNVINFITLPGCLFTCKSLEFLKLDGDLLIQVPSLVSLPKLESLNLKGVQFDCDESVRKLIQGCSVLKSLHIERTRYDNVVVFTVSSPTLRHLKIEARDSEELTFPAEVVLKLVINAPLLEYLHLADHVSKDCTFQSLMPLVQLHLYGHYNCHTQYIINWVLIKRVQALHQVKILSLGNINESDFTFLSLTKLTVSSLFVEWKPLLTILERSVHLEVLALTSLFPSYDETFENCVPRCLSSSLRRISFTMFNGNEHAHEMIRYFLKHGGVLERVELRGMPSLGVKDLKEILAFSRKSSACEVHVIDG